MVTITLMIEEVGVLDSDPVSDKYATRMYNISDPSGILDGELELVCTEGQLEGELKKLRAIMSNVPSASTTYKGYSSSNVSSYKGGYTNTAQKITDRASYKEAPDSVSASSLVNTLARDTGTTSVFTQLLGDLLDDILRPQSTRKKL
jgi:hypothetical protein